jgi:hypothetical protein
MKSEELRKTLWESDQSALPMKQGNACGGKGLGAAGKMVNLTGESPVLSVVHRVGSYIQLMGRKRLMGKPGSKSLSRKGKRSEGPEHKAKTAAPKFPPLVFADLVQSKGKAVGFQEEMDMCTETKPGVGVQAPQKRLVSKSQEGLVPWKNLAISFKSEMQEKT